MMTAFIVALTVIGIGQDEVVVASARSIAGEANEAKQNSAPGYTTALVDFGLFQPMQFPLGNWNPAGFEFEDVWFTSKDGTRINGWFFAAQNPRAVMLYAHGNAGNVTHRARLMRHLQTDQQVSVLVFDYRGYGRSDGIPTQGGMLADARAARAFLARKTSTGSPDLMLMGRSMGGAVVIQLAAEEAPKGLVVESTFTSLRDVADYLVPGSKTFVNANDLNSLKHIREYSGPLLHSHGVADRIIPYSQGRNLFTNAISRDKQHIRISGGTHNSQLPRTYYRALSQFVDRCNALNE